MKLGLNSYNIIYLPSVFLKTNITVYGRRQLFVQALSELPKHLWTSFLTDEAK